MILYERLLKTYGPQGWWPLLGISGSNPTKTGSITGYHPGDFSYPKDQKQRFEICVGAILTQNTSWVNVEKALIKLTREDMLDAKKVSKLDTQKLAELIRPSGYFNQKAKKLKIFSDFFLSCDDPTRDDLLQLWGIGNETADSILLFAYKKPSFIIDAYTARIISRISGKTYDYQSLQSKLKAELIEDVNIFQEYHALLVEHAKRHCRKKPICKDCPIYNMCKTSLGLVIKTN